MPDLNPAVDAYIEGRPKHQRPVLIKLRKGFHRGCPGAVETIKWGVPYFEYHGPLGSIAAFKHHVGWGFWRARELDDPDDLFEPGGAGQLSAAKFSEAADVPTLAVLSAYVRRAAVLNRTDPGGRQARAATPPTSAPATSAPAAPKDFLAALRAAPPAPAVWKKFTAAQRRDYILWITEAKRDATRSKRIATACAWIAEGKRRNWKYER